MYKKSKMLSIIITCAVLISSVAFPKNALADDNATGSMTFTSYNIATGQESTHSIESLQETPENAALFSAQQQIYSLTSSCPPILPSWAQESNANNNGGSTRVILGDSDQRTKIANTTVFPNSAIVWLAASFPNGDVWYGTGWMISANALTTAAHVIYKVASGGWATSVTAIPGKNGSTRPYGTFTSETMWISNEWKNASDPNWDLGIIKLSSAPDVGAFGFSVNSDSWLKGQTVRLTGYPDDKKGSDDHTQWTASDKIGNVTSFLVYHKIDTFSGQSGAPIFVDSTNTAVAVHTGDLSSTYNRGVRITQAHYDFMLSFRK